MNMKMLLKIVVAAILFWGSTPLSAQDCAIPDKEPNVLGRIERLKSQACFPEDADKTPLVASVRAFKDQVCLPETRSDLVSLRERLAVTSRDIEADASALTITAPDDWADQTRMLGQQLRQSTQQLATLDALSELSYWQWEGSRTLQPKGSNEFLLDYGPIISQRCPPTIGQPPKELTPDCIKAIAVATHIIRLVNLTASLHACVGTERLKSARKQLALLDTEWDDYFFRTHSQYIWELFLNERRHRGERASDRGNDLFARPPRDQIILLHPNAAYEYVGGGTRNDKSYRPIVFVEVLGYSRFGWDEDMKNGTATFRPGFGASLVATYTPDNTGSHLGYGFIVHAYNKYSLGVTRRDTGAGKDTSVLLSVDLMRFLLKPSDALMKSFRGAGAPDSATDK
jgi:hypothetical protein